MRFFVSSGTGEEGMDMRLEEAQGASLSGVVISDVGFLRPNNEDNYILGSHINENALRHSEAVLAKAPGDWQIAGVFDGMGGGELGEVAARMAAAVFRDRTGSALDGRSKAEIDDVLRGAFLEANNRIVELQKRSGILGTTGTLICVHGGAFKMYHLGDSRGYLFRQHGLLRLTRDQTLAQMRLDAGICGQNDPRIEADRHKLTNYIGKDRTGENLRPAESRWLPLLPGDRILLCTDGLYNACPEEEIQQILDETGTILDKAGRLVRAALSGGGQDNITCLLLSFS